MKKNHKQSRVKSFMNEANPFLKKYKNNNTRKIYKKALYGFFTFCISKGVKTTKEIKASSELIQDYSDYLNEQGYSASTVHTYLASACKYCNVNMKEINKQKRRTSRYTKGRTKPDRKIRSNCDLSNPKYERLVAFQKAVGIRRAELEKLTGKDFGYNEEIGFYYVLVRRGKGGKTQLQRILPEDEKFIESYFKDKAPDERIFSKEEMNNGLSLHTLRAENAKRTYAYYLDRIEGENGYKDKLRQDLITMFVTYNKGYNLLLSKGKYKQAEAKLEAFKKETEGIHRLYSDNKALALEHNLPTEYNKLAVMAVSVFHLSHWRNDVTIADYLLAY